MGLFSKFSKPSSAHKLPWNVLQSEDELSSILEASHTTPQILFKHSTRCSISDMALNRLERSWDLEDGKVVMHYLDLIKYRSISNAIASKFSVYHESPQMIVLKNGEVAGHTSHNQIDVAFVKAHLND